jgi:hypothetical protein
MGTPANATRREPWNKGKIVGQKVPFKPKDIWALRVPLQMEKRSRELALLTWASTASFADATSWRSRCATSATGSRSLRAPW